jgi:hypothetical protein
VQGVAIRVDGVDVDELRAAKAGIRYRQREYYTSLLQHDVPDTVRELFREKKYSTITGIGTLLKG